MSILHDTGEGEEYPRGLVRFSKLQITMNLTTFKSYVNLAFKTLWSITFNLKL